MRETEYKRNDILICATNGKIYAVHKKDGSRIWGCSFPERAYGNTVSVFVTDYDDVIIGAVGKIACLDLMTGEKKWLNKMSRMSTEEVSVVTTPSRFLQLKTNESNQTEDSPPKYSERNQLEEKPVVIGCSRGKVVAMDPYTGNTLWTYDCPGGGYNIPVALVEPPSLESHHPGQTVYIGAGKRVYCLSASTGEVFWISKVSNSDFGANYMTLATPWGSRLAAEGYTSFSQCPTGQAAHRNRT
ncbi:quinon protein alcohol dehydrogenase-like superfamily [Choanephora cucurbitarum]|nr:quinon protein alcohol dehydrogenase-like superfamily [Choanephora cucurbitarum]